MKNKVVITVIILLAAAAIGFFGYKAYHNHKLAASTRVAVFMTNGQVYFGYLKNSNEKSVTLNDVYYLKTQDLQNSNAKILLVKMGNELHGPQSTMYISRDQILFWQNLRSDSKINDAIARFIQNPSPTPSATTSGV